MKILNGDELASYIQEQQSYRVRSLRQSKGITPKLTVSAADAKQVPSLHAYGEDIQVGVEISSKNAVKFEDATATAVTWLLAGYNINLPSKNIVIIGKQLDFNSLAVLWQHQELTVDLIEQPDASVAEADILIFSTEVLGLIDEENLKPEAVIVTLEASQKLIVCALFDEAIRTSLL